jgi:hypothetical protein
MDTPDDSLPPPAVTRTAKHQDELNNLGRSWFAELRQQSERDAEEFADWKRGHRKWTVKQAIPIQQQCRLTLLT